MVPALTARSLHVSMPACYASNPTLPHRLLVPVTRPKQFRWQPAQAKMHVPSDSFQGKSPERQASLVLRTLFTFVACQVVKSQLQGTGRGEIGSYNTEQYAALKTLLEEMPMKSGDEWLSVMMRRNKMLAMRIMEVRSAYCIEDFEWEMCRNVTRQGMKDANVSLMRQYADIAFAKQVDGNNEAQKATTK